MTNPPTARSAIIMFVVIFAWAGSLVVVAEWENQSSERLAEYEAKKRIWVLCERASSLGHVNALRMLYLISIDEHDSMSSEAKYYMERLYNDYENDKEKLMRYSRYYTKIEQELLRMKQENWP